MDGKSWGLLAVLREHRAAIEYDWWSRFGRGLRSIGPEMSLSEAARLVEIIRADPSSALAASIGGWDYPVSREAAVLMDLWDLEAMKGAGKKAPRYHRPYKTAGQRERVGDAAGHSQADVIDLLTRARRGEIALSPA